MIAFGISTRNRKEQAMKCIESVYRYAPENAKIAICDDGSSDGTQEAIINWMNSSEAHKRVSFIARHERKGVAATKIALVDVLTMHRAVEDVILIEDDVQPLCDGWYQCFLDTAWANEQAHLLYLPTDWKYGKVLSTTGQDHTQIQWKTFCSAMVMYFRAALLRKVGNFDPRFGLFGWEHNLLTAQCLAAQGLHPEHYPHCLASETGNVVYATDVAETRPKMAYHEVAKQNKEMTVKVQMAHSNKPLYDREIVAVKAAYAKNAPRSAELRKEFFPLAKQPAAV